MSYFTDLYLISSPHKNIPSLNTLLKILKNILNIEKLGNVNVLAMCSGSLHSIQSLNRCIKRVKEERNCRQIPDNKWSGYNHNVVKIKSIRLKFYMHTYSSMWDIAKNTLSEVNLSQQHLFYVGARGDKIKKDLSKFLLNKHNKSVK